MQGGAVPSGRKPLRQLGEAVMDAGGMVCGGGLGGGDDHPAADQNDRQRRGAERDPGPALAVSAREQQKKNDTGNQQIQRVPPRPSSDAYYAPKPWHEQGEPARKR